MWNSSRVLSPLLGAMGSRSFVLGDVFSAADIIVGGLLLWADTTGQLSGESAGAAYLARLRERPAFQRAFTD